MIPEYISFSMNDPFEFKALLPVHLGIDSFQYDTTHPLFNQANLGASLPMLLVGAVAFMMLAGMAFLLWRYLEAVKKIREQQQQIAKYVELDRVKSEFFANLSHECRTPLTLIMENIRGVLLNQRTKLDEKRLAVAFRNSKSLLSLVDQILDLSKFESGHAALDVSTTNIVSVIKDLTEMFELVASQKKIDIKFQYAQPVIPVIADNDKIEKVICNLLSNALKFTPEGGRVLVDVDLIENGDLSLSGSKQQVKITVQDSGIGIPSDQLNNIFNRFHRLEHQTSRRYEGTGIGLALVKGFVELHDGSIHVDSDEGFGTKFTIYLPAGDSEKITVKSVKVKESLANSDPLLPVPFPDLHSSENETNKSSSRIFVLVIDDNADLRTLVREYLEDKYHVIEARNGEEGFIKAQEVVPNVVVTDIVMPGMDGNELVKKLKREKVTSHIPVIMLTAQTGQSERVQGLEAGADIYLTKPFDRKELELQVQKAVDRANIQSRLEFKPSEISVSSIDEQFLIQIRDVIEENLTDENFGLNELARTVGVGKRQLQRKLKSLTGKSPVQHIRSMRLARARQLLEQDAGTVSEICFKTGFNDVSSFSKSFRREFGFAPSFVKSTQLSKS